MSETPDAFRVLLEVQDLDTSISQLRHRRDALPERAQLQAAQQERQELEVGRQILAQQRDQLVDRQRRLETQIQTTNGRKEAIEQRMYSARGLPGRELEAMQGEVAHLEHRRRDLEDEELEVMVAQEPLDRELRPITERLADLDNQIGQLDQAVRSNEASIDHELQDVVERRRAEAAKLPPTLEQRYETLRRRLGGVGAARLIDDHCGGCHLTLPSMEVERIHRLPPDEIVLCEQCSRILVR